uniref:RNA exonuclease 5 n=1 Tax=Gasterosteus aculeatus aculeatus TaxID=481459 RepID=A0AAQ4RPT6_GASAC
MTSGSSTRLHLIKTVETSGDLPCNGRKRKRVAPAEAPGGSKRLKAAPEADDPPARGRSPGVSVLPDRLQRAVTAGELTELLHYAALGRAGGVKQPSWCRLHRQRRVKAVNVVIVEGLTQADFYKHYLALRHLRTSYSTRVTFTPPPGDLASGIFSGEVPETAAPSVSGSCTLHKALMTHPVITKFGTQRRGLTAYVLTEEEMIRRRYPVKGLPGFEEFVCTDCADGVTDGSPLYGVDCEMVHTVRGYELARVSLVDSDGNCLLDELVKPHYRILNYLTRFSGITSAMLRPVTTSLREVQVKLRKLLPSNAVLVGHALENDLTALKLIHRHVMDTSLLYRRDFGQKFKLKVLAEVVLQRQIQTGDQTGHNPIEDAVAALELAQYFIKMGPSQVVERHREELWGYAIVDEVADCEPEAKPSLRFVDVLQTLGRSVFYLGKRSDVPLDLSNQQWHNSDKALLASFRRRSRCPSLSVLKFSSLSDRPRPAPHRDGLRDMCVLFAGPLPAGASERDVRRLFGCCGAVRSVRLLSAAARVHAEVEFELLEGAALALNVLNGLHVHGQPIKVTLFPSCPLLSFADPLLTFQFKSLFCFWVLLLGAEARQRVDAGPGPNPGRFGARRHQHQPPLRRSVPPPLFHGGQWPRDPRRTSRGPFGHSGEGERHVAAEATVRGGDQRDLRSLRLGGQSRPGRRMWKTREARVHKVRGSGGEGGGTRLLRGPPEGKLPGLSVPDAAALTLLGRYDNEQRSGYRRGGGAPRIAGPGNGSQVGEVGPPPEEAPQISPRRHLVRGRAARRRQRSGPPPWFVPDGGETGMNLHSAAALRSSGRRTDV